MSNPHWLQLIFFCDTPEQAQQLSDRLSTTEALAITLQDNADEPIYEPELGTTPLWSNTRVIALFDNAQAIDNTLNKVGREISHKIEILEDQDWSRVWQKNFTPMQFGERLWIVPSWHEAPDANAVNIALDPGVAFGTGTHPTTALCLQWLDANLLRDQTVIDFGCGSGVLAIAACLLGAKEVFAVDIDGQAIQATQLNADSNQIARSQLHIGLPESLTEHCAEILIANILARPLTALRDHFYLLLKSRGKIVLSGILSDQVAQLVDHYDEKFIITAITEQEGWARIDAEKKSLSI